MVTAYDVDPQELIEAMAEKIERKSEIKPPDWSLYAKTGVHKERPPDREDWWYVRCASLLRRVYMDGPIGVSRLRSYYGGKQRRGSKRSHFRKGSGSIIRKGLQQLEKAGYVEKVGKGRKISPAGQSLLDNTAYEVIERENE